MSSRYPQSTTFAHDHEATPGLTDSCPACDDPDPHIRHRHYLYLAHVEGIPHLEGHLLMERQRRSLKSPDEIRARVRDTVQWVQGEMSTWSGLRHPETGASLAWWEARQQAHAFRNVLAVKIGEQTQKKGLLVGQKGTFTPIGGMVTARIERLEPAGVALGQSVELHTLFPEDDDPQYVAEER